MRSAHLPATPVGLVLYYYAPDRREKGNKRCFCPSVCLSVAYVTNNSRTQRPSVPKFGRNVPRLRRDSYTSFKVKRSKVRIEGGRGHTVSSEPGGYTQPVVDNDGWPAVWGMCPFWQPFFIYIL